MWRVSDLKKEVCQYLIMTHRLGGKIGINLQVDKKRFFCISSLLLLPITYHSPYVKNESKAQQNA